MATESAQNPISPTNTKPPSSEDGTDGPPLGYDLSRSYGRNWTKTNVSTLFDWLTVAAFNMQCLDYAITQHRGTIRNFTIFGLVITTLSGTISLSQFGLETDHYASRILQGFFTLFTFSLAIYTGYIKIYQIQERLEQFIKLRQDWAVFATTIGSELQLPIELRRDALHLIVKYKSIYLDLIKIDIEVPESMRIRAEQSLPKTLDTHIQVMNLPSTLITIGIQELDDIHTERQRNKDRYSASKSSSAKTAAATNAEIKLPPLPISPENSVGGVQKSLGAIKSKRDIGPPPVFSADVKSPIPTPAPALPVVAHETPDLSTPAVSAPPELRITVDDAV